MFRNSHGLTHALAHVLPKKEQNANPRIWWRDKAADLGSSLVWSLSLYISCVSFLKKCNTSALSSSTEPDVFIQQQLLRFVLWLTDEAALSQVWTRNWAPRRMVLLSMNPDESGCEFSREFSGARTGSPWSRTAQRRLLGFGPTKRRNVPNRSCALCTSLATNPEMGLWEDHCFEEQWGPGSVRHWPQMTQSERENAGFCGHFRPG